MVCQLSGQFSLSPTGPIDGSLEEDKSPSDKSADSPPNGKMADSDLVLTFYRRNLFQVSCSVTNAQTAMYAETAGSKEHPGQLSRIIGLSMQVSVNGTDKAKPPKLLYTPPKPDGSKQEQLPSIKPLWPKENATTEVIDWKRLQFRSATAHNGRRRLQNYFTLTVAVFAELANRERVQVTHAKSHPIVVRGRNPQFYSNRQTISISDTHLRHPAPISAPGLHSNTTSAPTSSVTPPIKEERKSPISGSSEDDDDDSPLPLKRSESDDGGTPSKKSKYKHSRYEEDEEEDDNENRYEYYPMPAAYYQPPVDVVYRPHAVTHVASVGIKMETGLKRQFAVV